MADLDNVFAADGALARAIPGYRVRPQQIEMAERIAAAVQSHGVLVAEAGTGTGKTFAYLVPALMAGDNVTLTISPTHDTPDSHGPGSANIQRMTTTVSGRLGEWMSIGGSTEERAGEESGTLRYSTRGGSTGRSVQLRVEELP